MVLFLLQVFCLIELENQKRTLVRITTVDQCHLTGNYAMLLVSTGLIH